MSWQNLWLQEKVKMKIFSEIPSRPPKTPTLDKVNLPKDIKNFIDLVNELDGLQDIKFTYVTSKEIDNDLLIDADVLFIRSTTKIDKKLLENSSVKLIGSATAGIDHVDIDYLESSQIRWFYSPGCNSSSVVHYVLSSIGYLKKINVMNEDSILGIIGCGNVGAKLRLILNKLKIKKVSTPIGVIGCLLYTSPSPRDRQKSRMPSSA